MTFPETRNSDTTTSPDDYRRATLNILEDFDSERIRMLETQSAILNMFEDSVAEKRHLDDMHKAVINILDDFTLEKTHTEETQRAIGNILDDFSEEKGRLEQTQSAMLNLLEDFDSERFRAEAASRDLAKSLELTRQAKEEEEEANRELESFSYSVAHDLRAPLRAMDGFSQALLDSYRGSLDEQGQDFLLRVRSAAQRMALLIDNLLMLSRVTRAERRFEEVSLTNIAGAAMARLRAAEPRRECDLDVAENLVVRGDAGLLEIALGNLIGNSWKFTSPRARARIEVGMSDTDGKPVYFVRDNGVGFDMAYASKLFSPFQRLHSDKEFGGTGIGLAIVARIVKRHGGRIWAEGAVDGGSTFYFTLGGKTQ